MSAEIIDEDAPISSLSSNPALQEDHDPEDETADFRFLSTLNPKTSLPKRGEKDFESHGTNKQKDVLQLSREAMHDALSYTRVHNHSKKSSVRGWYMGAGVEGAQDVMGEEIRGKGLGEDWVVMVQVARGPMFKAMGRAPKGISSHNLWLLPEEALYLVERGDMDLYWPKNPADVISGKYQDLESEVLDDEEADIPLSLQAAWALLIGDSQEAGRVDIDKYTVYANLKRNGYAVLRATDENVAPDITLQDGKPFSIFSYLFGSYFAASPPTLPSYGPLVTPGLYRSYSSVYRRLAVIPRHSPTAHPADSTEATEPFRVDFFIYKTSRIATFAKSSPGIPDFRVAVVPTRARSGAHTSIPTLAEITSLLESTPWDPPPKGMTGDAKSYARLKYGFRNVVLAVVDQGITSFLRVSEAGFTEESLVPKFDRSGGQRGGGKNGRGGRGGGGGGRGGRGGGRGRGRGRGK